MPVVEVEPNHSLVEAWPNSAPAFYNICDHFVMLLHSLYITFVKINFYLDTVEISYSSVTLCQRCSDRNVKKLVWSVNQGKNTVFVDSETSYEKIWQAGAELGQAQLSYPLAHFYCGLTL